MTKKEELNLKIELAKQEQLVLDKKIELENIKEAHYNINKYNIMLDISSAKRSIDRIYKLEIKNNYRGGIREIMSKDWKIIGYLKIENENTFRVTAYTGASGFKGSERYIEKEKFTPEDIFEEWKKSFQSIITKHF